MDHDIEVGRHLLNHLTVNSRATVNLATQLVLVELLLHGEHLIHFAGTKLLNSQLVQISHHAPVLNLNILSEVQTHALHLRVLTAELLQHVPLKLRPSIPCNPVKRLFNGNAKLLRPQLRVIGMYQLVRLVQVFELVKADYCDIIVVVSFQQVRSVAQSLNALVNVDNKHFS